MEDSDALKSTDVTLANVATIAEQSAPLRDTSSAEHIRTTPAAIDLGIGRSQRSVPYGALAEERARRRELQRELQNSVDEQRKLQGRLDLLQEIAQQSAQNGEARGTPGDEAGMDAEAQEVASDRSTEAQDQTGADAAFRTQLMHSVRDAMRERPDFIAAYQHARQARVSELMALGYAPQEALGITFDNELEIIRNAYAKGTNPAQVIYDYARRRGYRGGEQIDARNGAAASSTYAAVPSAAERVALAARGQAASKSLSAAGGGSTGSLTLEALAGMSDEEFAEATKGERWQKLLK